MKDRKGAQSKRYFWSPGALKRANKDMEEEIREAFCDFLTDCRDVVTGKLIKQQLDDDLKYVSAALGDRKPSPSNDNEN